MSSCCWCPFKRCCEEEPGWGRTPGRLWRGGLRAGLCRRAGMSILWYFYINFLHTEKAGYKIRMNGKKIIKRLSQNLKKLFSPQLKWSCVRGFMKKKINRWLKLLLQETLHYTHNYTQASITMHHFHSWQMGQTWKE